MLIVGTDQLTVMGSVAVPDGTRHAVDRNGRVLCRTTRPRFSWPALTWDHRSDDAACRLCAQVRLAQEAVSDAPAYPAEAPVSTPAPSPSKALMPWQPARSLFDGMGLADIRLGESAGQ